MRPSRTWGVTQGGSASRTGKTKEVATANPVRGSVLVSFSPPGSGRSHAAWWALTILAHNLNAAMKRLVLGKGWVTKRMKALRFRLIGLPGRVVVSVAAAAH
jgi:hypothetical protein